MDDDHGFRPSHLLCPYRLNDLGIINSNSKTLPSMARKGGEHGTK